MTSESVPVYLLIDGFEQSCDRFYLAMKSTSRDATFIPLFEALNWAVSIDERLQKAWSAAPTNPAKFWSDGFAHGDTVKGVRFARNRVHHQWADALWLSLDSARLPSRNPRPIPFGVGEWSDPIFRLAGTPSSGASTTTSSLAARSG